MANTIPQFDSLVQGDGYAAASPGPDTLSPGLGDSTIGGLPSQGANTVPRPDSPLQPMLAGFTTQDAPNLAQLWSSGDKGTNWMGNPSYPTSDTGTEPIK